MRWKHGPLLFLFVLGFAILTLIPAQAESTKKAPSTSQLIDQLASSDYETRQAAQEALEQLGVSALAEIRQAAKAQQDMEVKMRLAKLVRKLEGMVQNEKILKPTLVTLDHKDTALKVVLADLNKQTGFVINVADQNLLAKKITIQTGKVSFWEAYDVLCEKAGLVEANANNGRGNPYPPGYPQPPIGINPVPQPAIPINRPVIRLKNNVKKPVQKKVAPKKKVDPKLEKKKRDEIRKRLEAARKAQRAEAQKARIQIRQLIQQVQQQEKQKKAKEEEQKKQQKEKKAKEDAKARAVKQIQLQAQQAQLQQVVALKRLIVSEPYYPGGQPQVNRPISLKAGQPQKVPTAYVGALRLRLLKSSPYVAKQGGSDEIQIVLEVTPEPKIQWQMLESLTIGKAVDGENQDLMPVLTQPVNQPNYGYTTRFGGFRGQVAWESSYRPYNPRVSNGHYYLPIRLRKGEKASKALKELTGALCAKILMPTESLITVDNILTANKKTVKGKHGGSLDISNVTQTGSTVQVQVTFDRPLAFQVNNNWNGNMIFNNGAAIQIQNQIRIINGRQAPQRGNVYGVNGLIFIDDKGKPVRTWSSSTRYLANNGGAQKMAYTLNAEVAKGQKISKLVFLGRRQAAVSAKFRFRNVDVAQATAKQGSSGKAPSHSHTHPAEGGIDLPQAGGVGGAIPIPFDR